MEDLHQIKIFVQEAEKFKLCERYKTMPEQLRDFFNEELKKVMQGHNMNSNEDEVIRDLLLNSSSDMNISDEPTVITLYDTVEVLEKRNPNWTNDEFCQMILAWQAAHFLNDHADQVIQEKCPHLKELCIEYRKHETMKGKRLDHMFGVKALHYIMPKFEEPYLEGPFGTSPVRDCYFKVVDNAKI